MKFIHLVISFFSALAAGLFMSSCDGNDNGGSIPYVPVNVSLDLNDPRYIDLNPYGGYLILPNQGNKGLIVYHQFDDTYVCYDLTCSYEPTNPCNQLEIEENGFLLQCGETVNGTFEPCCGSKFLWDGFPASGPAIYSLAYYPVYRNGNILRISN